jgi:hypothetical protein
MRRHSGDRMVDLVRSGRTPEALSREFEPTAQAIWTSISAITAPIQRAFMSQAIRREVI